AQRRGSRQLPVLPPGALRAGTADVAPACPTADQPEQLELGQAAEDLSGLARLARERVYGLPALLDGGEQASKPWLECLRDRPIRASKPVPGAIDHVEHVRGRAHDAGAVGEQRVRAAR